MSNAATDDVFFCRGKTKTTARHMDHKTLTHCIKTLKPPPHPRPTHTLNVPRSCVVCRRPTRRLRTFSSLHVPTVAVCAACDENKKNCVG